MGNRVSEAYAPPIAKVLPIKRYDEPTPEPKQSWVVRAATWLGITMANTEHPRGWSWSPATATLMILVVTLIAGGAYYLGGRDKQVDMLERRLEGVGTTANVAIDRATYAAGLKDKEEGHGTNTNTNTKTGGH